MKNESNHKKTRKILEDNITRYLREKDMKLNEGIDLRDINSVKALN